MNHVWRPYTQMLTEPPPLPVVGTEGCRLRLADGRTLVDGIASWWTACHGYNHPHIRDAVQAQLHAMPHVMFGGASHAPAERLGARLANLLPGDLDHVFFTESGSVSVEVALKMVVQGWQNVGRPNKSRIAAFSGGYHGDTFATMALCDPSEGMHRRFAGWLPRVDHLAVPTTDAARARVMDYFHHNADQTAAVVIDPLVQAAGGFRFHPPGTLTWLRQACVEHEVMLIFDEIAVGFGRLGAMFGCTCADVVPDVVTLSKALTGGTLPLAATVARTQLYERFLSRQPGRALMHGPTYMANPMGCAAANASLDLFEREPRLASALSIGDRLRRRLAPCRDIPGVVDVRVWGALGVVELDAEDAVWLRQRFVEEGVWIRPLERAVYLMPPLVISREELDRLTSAIHTVLEDWSHRRRPLGA